MEKKRRTLNQFLDHFCNFPRDDKKFCFILGSGASKSSNIPTGWDLVQKWDEELKGLIGEEALKEWKDKESIDDNDLARDYSKIFDKRFETCIKDGYAYLEEIMTNKTPGCGYAYFAKVIEKTRQRVIITTNFDSLIEDAFFIYTQIKPRIVGHESLASYIQLFNTRPIIIKIHRDLFFDPKNRVEDTNELDPKLAKSLDNIFEHYIPVVIGYGGNDGSLMDYLEQLEKVNGGMFWFYLAGHEPGERINNIINKFNGFAIPINGFDNLMLDIGDCLKMDISKIYTDIKNNADKNIKDFQDQVKKIREDKSTPEETKESLNNMWSRSDKDWFYYAMKAKEEKDIDKKEEIYLEGLKEFPNSAELINSYAMFLHYVMGNYSKAEQYINKAIELEPNNANYINNYANFLYEIRKDDNKAEKLYKKALEIEPQNAKVSSNYAIFLKTIRKDFNKAEELYKKALEIEPDNAGIIGNYALFLKNIREDYDKAEELYKKVLELEPNDADFNGNYASFLENIRKDYDRAEEFYKKALELEPENANIIGNYAIFLKNIRKNSDKAEELYKKALEIEPEHANNNGNYASFLYETRKEYNKAEELYKKALEIEPDNANLNGNYASFLYETRKEFDKAEELYKKALEIEPENTSILNNYAYFQKTVRKDFSKAEELYQEAILHEPENARANGMYANFISEVRKDFEKAEELYKKALDIEPDNAINNGNYSKFLIAKRKFDKARKYIDKAFELNSHKLSELDLELWFYRYAVFFEEYPQAQEEIEKLLAEGVNSPGWYLDDVIEVAKERNHPNFNILTKLAERISAL